MADGGLDPSLALFGPQYLQIQRQQALAEKLMGAQPVPTTIGGYPTGPGAFLASGLSNILGAYVGKKSDQALANLYQQSGLLGGPRSFQPANANAPSVDTGYGTIPVPSATANPMNWQQSQQGQPLWVQAKLIGMQYGPEAAQAYIASDGDMNAVKRALSVKSLPPAAKGYGWVPDPNNPSQWVEAGIPTKEEIGGAGQPPQVGYVAPPTLGTAPTSTPEGNVNLSVAPPNVPRTTGNLGVDYNNPMNLQPGNKETYFQNPTAGVLAADHLLQQYGSRGINTVSKIVSTWAPQAPPQYAAQIAQKMGVQPDQPLNLGDVNVRGAYLEAASPHETGRPLPTAGQGGPQQPPSASPQQAPHILTEQEKQSFTAQQKAKDEAVAALPHVRANTQQLLQELDDLGKTSADIPASLGGKTLEGAYWADQNFPGVTPYGGKLATAIQRWEQIGNSKALANIAQIAQSGVGRMDIPIVNAIKQASIAPWNLTSQGRQQLLQQLRAMVINNQTVAENTARGFQGQAPMPMQSGFAGPQAQPKPQIATQSQQFVEGKVYRDKAGNTARFHNGQWIEVAR